jgi:phosphoribosylanthranilate isomerase
MTAVVRVKICGLTRVDDAVACARLGAEWIGLNFHPGSRRYVAPAVAAAIVAALPGSAQAVGVFVDRTPSEVATIANSLGISIVQLHGNEPAEDLVELRSFQIIRAFRLNQPSDWSPVTEYLQSAVRLGRAPDAVLIDAYAPGQIGGTGLVVADDVLDSIPPLPRLILAGGLTPENVAKRAARVRPWMVDVASGVESFDGRKDLERVEAFIRAAHDADFDVQPA